MYFNRKCKITFICHGATIYTEEHRFSDVENYPQLSEYGQEEVERVCEFLKRRGVKNDVIYTSPAARTIQTAKMISKLYKQDYVAVDELKPRKCGKLNGLTIEQIETKYPNLLEQWFNVADYDDELEAESINDFIKHTVNTINDLVEKNNGNRIIVVTHPEVIQAAICDALGMPADKIAKVFIQTGSATQISYYEKWSSVVYSDHVPSF
ncbi:histidine phosphatase family protein [bacterium]|nr:histidine phosphatase family protein [bacterium]